MEASVLDWGMEGKCKEKRQKKKRESCTLGIKLDVDGQETTVRVGELKESEKGKKNMSFSC